MNEQFLLLFNNNNIYIIINNYKLIYNLNRIQIYYLKLFFMRYYFNFIL